MSFLITFAKWTQTDYCKRAAVTQLPQLVSIPFSHYVEYSRWALQHQGVAFEEHGFAPGYHILPALATRVSAAKGTVVSSSSFTQPVKSRSQSIPSTANIESESLLKKKRAKEKQARSTAVPLLVLPNGDILPDSWSIANYALDAPDIDKELFRLLDEEVGPLTRQLAYSYLLLARNASTCDNIFVHKQGWVWRLIYAMGGGQLLKKQMGKMFKPDNDTAREVCREKLNAAFEQLNLFLRTKKGRFLCGDELSASDIAFAALTAPVVVPPEYCLGEYTSYFNEAIKNDPLFAKEVEHWRSTPAGQYTLELYRNHRTATIMK